MKINIHTDQYIVPAQSKPAPKAPASVSDAATDISNETSASSNINSGLNAVDAARAARVSQLQGLYISGRYSVNSAQLAQSLVSGALSK